MRFAYTKPYYCEVEYLESTGTQYIDTDIVPTSTIKVETDFQLTSRPSDTFASLFGCVNNSYQGFMLFLNYTVPIQARTGNNANPNVVSTYSVNTDRLNLILEFNKLTINENIFTPTSDNTWVTMDRTMYVFGGNDRAVNISKRLVAAKIYSFKLRNNGTLVRDFIPVLDWNMTPCLYDRVSRRLFYNQGTGTFSYGREIHYVDYIETTGTQFVNTGLFPYNVGRWELDAQFTTIEQINNNDQVNGVYGYTQQRFDIGVGVSRNPSKPPFILNLGAIQDCLDADTNRHTFVLDNINNYVSVDDTQYLVSHVNFTTQTNYPILIANRRYVNNTVNYYCKEKIYGSKFYDTNGTIISDFCPAKDKNGVGFLFDRITHSCFLNAGTGSFVLGNEKDNTPKQIRLLKTYDSGNIKTRLIEGD